jgi:hypothetical protein
MPLGDARIGAAIAAAVAAASAGILIHARIVKNVPKRKQVCSQQQCIACLKDLHEYKLNLVGYLLVVHFCRSDLLGRSLLRS